MLQALYLTDKSVLFYYLFRQLFQAKNSSIVFLTKNVSWKGKGNLHFFHTVVNYLNKKLKQKMN